MSTATSPANNENYHHNPARIEIPWTLVKELSRSSLPQRCSYSIKKASPDYDGFSKLSLRSRSLSRFPSLSVRNTPDLVVAEELESMMGAQIRQNERQVSCNVLQTYVVDENIIPPMLSKNKKNTSSESNKSVLTKDVMQRLSRSRSLCKSDSPADFNHLSSIYQPHKKSKFNHTTPKWSNNRHESTINLDHPANLSPLKYTANYRHTWSPTEERNLADMWKKGRVWHSRYSVDNKNTQFSRSSTDINLGMKNASKLTDTNKTPKHKAPAKNHIYRFSKHTEGWNGDRSENHLRNSRMLLASANAEPPTLSTSPIKYITTWLDAGGEIPCFTKAT